MRIDVRHRHLGPSCQPRPGHPRHYQARGPKGRRPGQNERLPGQNELASARDTLLCRARAQSYPALGPSPSRQSTAIQPHPSRQNSAACASVAWAVHGRPAARCLYRCLYLEYLVLPNSQPRLSSSLDRPLLSHLHCPRVCMERPTQQLSQCVYARRCPTTRKRTKRMQQWQDHALGRLRRH